MPHVLLATDADWIRDDVSAALTDPDTTVSRVHTGAEVLPAVHALNPDLVILDLQIGNMGGIATCYELRLEAGAGRIEAVRILVLLDRADDRFLARTANADGWMVKPLDAFRIRRAAKALLAGEHYNEDLTAAT